jgi:hypothetical protein
MIFLNWNSEWARPGMTRGTARARSQGRSRGYSIDISVCEV